MSSHHIASQPIPYTHALRVEVRLEEGNAVVTAIHRVAMRAPASAPGQPADGQSGTWVELRNAAGGLLYHRALRTLHPDSVEVFEDEKSGTLRRVQTARPQVMKFDVIIPDLPDATEFRLSGARDPSRTHRPSVLLLRSPMPELRNKATVR